MVKAFQVAVSLVILNLLLIDCAVAQSIPPLAEIQVTSTRDQKPQSVRLWVPDHAKVRSTAVIVYLHSWSGDYTQDNSAWQAEAVRRGWIYLHPDFRGRNDHPEACGSALARQDVLDALDHVLKTYRVDSERIYLAGTSGGGHMSMLMAAWHPDRFSAVSAWVGISDLSEWYRFHAPEGKPDNYGQMMNAVFGGPPGTSEAIDMEFRYRSPVSRLHQAKELPIDIAAGVEDGHTGSVPVKHSLKAFNILAYLHRVQLISDDEISQISVRKRLTRPLPEDTRPDPTFGRAIHLRRTAGPSRVTIFEGGHEGLPKPAFEWLEKQRGLAKSP